MPAVVQNPGPHLRLVVEALLVADDLERPVAARLVVQHLEHLPKGALAQHAQHLVPGGVIWFGMIGVVSFSDAGDVCGASAMLGPSGGRSPDTGPPPAHPSPPARPRPGDSPVGDVVVGHDVVIPPLIIVAVVGAREVGVAPDLGHVSLAQEPNLFWGA